MATPNKQGKAMSSRLAGMKFMQRGAASGPNTPTTPAEPPSKKQRLSNGSSIRSPATAVDSEEQAAANRGETKWYLSFKAPQVQATESPLRIVSAGYSALDTTAQDDDSRSADDREETTRPQVAGRKNFGNFKKAAKQESDEDSSEDDEEAGEIEDDPTGVKALIAQGRKDATDRARAERKAKKDADNAESQRLADQRRKKGVNLNNVTSISSSGGRLSGAGRQRESNIICHRCGEKGHMIKDCPNSRRMR